MLGRLRLHDLFAVPAGELGAMGDDHPVLRRHHVEPLGRFLADHMHRLIAAGAVRIVRRKRLMNAWQMGGQRTALVPPFPAAQRRSVSFPRPLRLFAIAGSRSSSAN